MARFSEYKLTEYDIAQLVREMADRIGELEGDRHELMTEVDALQAEIDELRDRISGI